MNKFLKTHKDKGKQIAEAIQIFYLTIAINVYINIPINNSNNFKIEKIISGIIIIIKFK